MTDRDTPDVTPDTLADLPLQPTGSGVADLEIAYEQMKLAEDADRRALTADDGADATAIERDEPEAHPS